jgi:hypothetical protein
MAVIGAPNNKPPAEKEWTVMMYWDADNNLEFTTEFCMSIWEDTLVTNEFVNIVVFVDILSEDGIWIYDIVNQERHLVAEWPEMNSSDPATLEQFVEFTLSEFPAEKNMLVLQDHGYGWRGICQDETNGDVLMPMDGIGQALRNVIASSGKMIDILAFDACNMATLEVAYELRDSVKIVVGSETMVPFDGLPYRMFVTDMVNDPEISPAELANNIVEEYVLYYSSKRGYDHIMTYSQDFATIAAIDMSKMDALGEAFNAVAEALEPLIKDHMKEIERARGYALVGTWTNMAGYEWMPDVYTFIDGLRTVIGHPELTAAIDSFEMAFDEAVFAQANSKKYHDTVHGLNFWFPPSLAQYNMMGWTWARQFVYEDIGLDLVESTNWYDCLMTYYDLR